MDRRGHRDRLRHLPLRRPGEILISYETFAHVRNQIRCEEHGEIEVKGIAYPVATYRVVDSYEYLGRERRHFREERPNVVLDLDFEALTADDQSQAATILRRALDLLTNSDDPVQPEEDIQKEPDRQRGKYFGSNSVAQFRGPR